MIVLYLKTSEKGLFDKLPHGLKAGIDPVTETLVDSYEDSETLAFRASIAPFKNYRELRQVVERVKSAKSLEDCANLDGVSAETVAEFFYTIGAKGIDDLMEIFFKIVRTSGDVKTLALLSQARHEILSVNHSICYVC